MAILASQATRRDAKSYFGRFGPHDPTPKLPEGLITSETAPREPIRTAIVKVCVADSLATVDILPGLARTFVQLGRLGMPACLIVEPEDKYHNDETLSTWNSSALREKYENTVYRIVDAIEAQGGRAQPLIGDVLSQRPFSSAAEQAPSISFSAGELERLIQNSPVEFSHWSRDLIHHLLTNGQIPVIAPIAGGIKPSLLPILARS